MVLGVCTLVKVHFNQVTKRAGRRELKKKKYDPLRTKRRNVCSGLLLLPHPRGVEGRAGDVAAAAGSQEVLRNQPPLAIRGSSQLQEGGVIRARRPE